MKKNHLFLATAIVALAGCSDNTYMGDLEGGAGTGAISFNMNASTLSRAQDHATSAATLNNQFIVWGEKSNAAEANTAGTPVFINYVVNYVASSAQTTESNSHDWEYVAQSPYANTKVVASDAPTHVTEQTIKYWDFTNKYYTFTAISAKPADITGDKVTVTKNVSGSTVYDKGYTVKLKADASISDIYFSDRTLVTATSPMTSPVTLNFRNLLSQVRFGFYETIPGYSVTITNVKFNSGASHTSNGDGNFGVDGSVVIPGATTSFTVTYDDGSVIDANQNKAKVAVSTQNTQSYLSTTATSFFGTTLGTSSSARTWENGGNYTKILPNPSNTTDLTLTISYRLTSTDGSGETIDITDATAKVPAAYAKWQSNYAYTYLFKISDNNGLYPITFDAVVVEDEAGNQETITTVDNPSITTYANGKVVTTNDEYLTGKDIYVVVDNAGTVQALTVGTIGVTDASANAWLYEATVEDGAAQGITEMSVDNAIANGVYDATNHEYTVTDANSKDLVVKVSAVSLSAITEIAATDSPTGIAITVNGAKFSPAAGKTYVFQYQVTKPTFDSGTVLAADTSLKGYYTKSSETYTRCDDAANADGSTTYYKVTTPGVYQYKVIKIVAAP